MNTAGHFEGQSAAGRHKRRLVVVFVLTAVWFVAEVAGGLLTNSLALLADAGHMLTDVGSLALALFAMRLAERPATPSHTYGLYRVEILAAMANAIALLAVSVYVFVEAWRRLANPEPVAASQMIAIAVVGFFVNLAGALLLRDGAAESLNIRGAYLEVLADLLASIGVIGAAVVMKFTNWHRADAVASIAIAILILPRGWVLLRDAVGILLEGTPSHVSLASLREALANLDGVDEVHDLHVWCLTSGMNAMSVHVVIVDDSRHDEILETVHRTARERFGLGHVTVQLETRGWRDCEAHL